MKMTLNEYKKAIEEVAIFRQKKPIDQILEQAEDDLNELELDELWNFASTQKGE